MLWECLSSAGTGKPTRIKGNMEGTKYKAILLENLFESASDFRLASKQDNDPVHTAQAILAHKWVDVLS